MPALQVRDFPEELYRQLRERARLEHRSISQQTVIAVDSYLSFAGGLAYENTRAFVQDAAVAAIGEDRENQQRVQKRKALFSRINSRPPLVIPDGFPSPEELVREDRDAR